MQSYVLVGAAVLALVALSAAAFFCSSRGRRRRLASSPPSTTSRRSADVELGLREAQASYPTSSTARSPEHREVDVGQAAGYPTSTVHVYSSRQGGEGDGADDAAHCAVCLEEYAGGEELRRLPYCGHAFHRRCVDQWLRLHATCPVCRASPTGTSDTLK